MSELFAALDIIGALAFFAAAFLALGNYQRTRRISNYWLIFGMAMLLASAVASIMAVENLGVQHGIIVQLDTAIAIIAVTLLIVTAIETLTTYIRVTIE